MSARNKNRITRRQFMKGTALLGGTLAGSRLLSALAVPFSRLAGYVPAADPWSELPAILARALNSLVWLDACYDACERSFSFNRVTQF